MPGNMVKTAREEAMYAKAKEQAAKQGKSDDFAYIMGIYKRMKARSDAAKRPHNPRMTAPKRKYGSY